MQCSLHKSEAVVETSGEGPAGVGGTVFDIKLVPDPSVKKESVNQLGAQPG